MAQRNDQVFQLSLTEIAFTVSFVLLLLLGYLVVKEQSEREKAEAALAKMGDVKQATASYNSAKGSLVAALQSAGSGNPDDVISKLVAAEQLRQERDALRRRIEDLDAQLTALTELKERLARATETSKQDVTQDQVVAALVLQEKVHQAIAQAEATRDGKPEAEAATSKARQDASSVGAAPSQTSSGKGEGEQASPQPSHDRAAVNAAVQQAIVTTAELRRQLKDALGRDLKRGEEGQTVKEVIAAARSFGELTKVGYNPETIKKENSDLRGQVAFLKNRLDARGGRDYPPCWADENGKVEFLFAVEVRQDSVLVTPAWPGRREGAARSLPGIEGVLAGPHSYQAFASKIQDIFNWSKSQDPECRHYVQLKSSISDAVTSDRARLMVENYFYKVEARR